MRALLLLAVLGIAIAAPAASAIPGLGINTVVPRPVTPDCVGPPCDLLASFCQRIGRPWCAFE